MSETTTPPETFLPLRQAAHRLGVPTAWLRGEADAGRVPHLLVGRRLMFNLQLVERTLIDRASNSGNEQPVREEVGHAASR